MNRLWQVLAGHLAARFCPAGTVELACHDTLFHHEGVLWYRVNKTDLVRLVIVRDPDGIEPDDYFFTTDLTATAADVASRYTARWGSRSACATSNRTSAARTLKRGNARDPNAPQRFRCGGTQRSGAGTYRPTPKDRPGSRGPGTEPRPLPASSTLSAACCGPNEYSHVPLRNRRHENHRDATRHARLRRLTESKNAKVH